MKHARQHNSKPFAIINTPQVAAFRAEQAILPSYHLARPESEQISSSTFPPSNKPTNEPTNLPTYLLPLLCAIVSASVLFLSRCWLSGLAVLCSALRFSDRIWIKVKFIVFISHDSLQSSRWWWCCRRRRRCWIGGFIILLLHNILL